jgi:hypothetical protein
MSINTIGAVCGVIALGALLYLHGCKSDEVRYAPTPGPQIIVPTVPPSPTGLRRLLPHRSKTIPAKIAPVKAHKKKSPPQQYRKMLPSGKLDTKNVTCKQVRSYVVGRTKAQLDAAAKQFNITRAQLDKAVECLN